MNKKKLLSESERNKLLAGIIKEGYYDNPDDDIEDYPNGHFDVVELGYTDGDHNLFDYKLKSGNEGYANLETLYSFYREEYPEEGLKSLEDILEIWEIKDGKKELKQSATEFLEGSTNFDVKETIEFLVYDNGGAFDITQIRGSAHTN